MNKLCDQLCYYQSQTPATKQKKVTTTLNTVDQQDDNAEKKLLQSALKERDALISQLTQKTEEFSKKASENENKFISLQSLIGNIFNKLLLCYYDFTINLIFLETNEPKKLLQYAKNIFTIYGTPDDMLDVATSSDNFEHKTVKIILI